MDKTVGTSNQILSIHLDSRHLASVADAKAFFDFLFLEVKCRLVSTVLSQQLTKVWAPLSKAYKAHKVRYGLHPGAWVSTEKLINSLSLDLSVGADFAFARILCHPGQSHNGVPMWMIAKYLEYGTRKIPPRPLFRPIAESIQHDMPQLLKAHNSGEAPGASTDFSYLASSVSKFVNISL